MASFPSCRVATFFDLIVHVILSVHFTIRKENWATSTELPRSMWLWRAPVRVLTSIEFLNDGTKVYETPLVEADSLNVPDRDAVSFQFDVPLTQLKPGTYICQVNVIDDAGGSFSFPRMAMKAVSYT